MRVLMPESLGEAKEQIGSEEGAVLMSGGTDLLVHWPQRWASRATTYIDLSGVEELRPHRWTESELVLGGRTTFWDLIRDERVWKEFPMLIRAARQVGAVQIQARGTWAGNIANASPAADGVPVLMACDAIVVLGSTSGREEIALNEFYLGYKQMRMGAGQIIEEIRIPRRGFTHQRFEKVGSRRAQAIAKVGLALAKAPDGWRAVAASVAPTIRRCPNIERMLDTHEPAPAPEDYFAAIDRDVEPIDDLRSTAEYRRHVLARVLHAALAPDGQAPLP